MMVIICMMYWYIAVLNMRTEVKHLMLQMLKNLYKAQNPSLNLPSK